MQIYKPSVQAHDLFLPSLKRTLSNYFFLASLAQKFTACKGVATKEHRLIEVFQINIEYTKTGTTRPLHAEDD